MQQFKQVATYAAKIRGDSPQETALRSPRSPSLVDDSRATPRSSPRSSPAGIPAGIAAYIDDGAGSPGGFAPRGRQADKERKEAERLELKAARERIDKEDADRQERLSARDRRSSRRSQDEKSPGESRAISPVLETPSTIHTESVTETRGGGFVPRSSKEEEASAMFQGVEDKTVARSGSLTVSEGQLVSHLQAQPWAKHLLQRHGSDYQWPVLFSRYDTDGDHLLDETEFVALYTEKLLPFIESSDPLKTRKKSIFRQAEKVKAQQAGSPVALRASAPLLPAADPGGSSRVGPFTVGDLVVVQGGKYKGKTGTVSNVAASTCRLELAGEQETGNIKHGQIELVMTVSDQEYRLRGLIEVYEAFDFDNDGHVGHDEMLELGQARRKLGHKTSIWTEEKNAQLMGNMRAGLDGAPGPQFVTEANFVRYFNVTLTQNQPDFLAKMDDYMQAALSLAAKKRAATAEQERQAHLSVSESASPGPFRSPNLSPSPGSTLEEVYRDVRSAHASKSVASAEAEALAALVLQDKEAELAQCRRDLADSRREVNEVNRSLHARGESCDQCHQDLRNAQRARDALLAERDAALNQLERLRVDRDAEVATLRESLDSARRGADSASGLQAELEAARRKAAQLEAELLPCQKELRETLAELAAARLDCANDADRHADQLRLLEADLEEARRSQSKLEDSNRRRIAQLEEELARRKAERDAEMESRARAHAMEIESLQEMLILARRATSDAEGDGVLERRRLAQLEAAKDGLELALQNEREKSRTAIDELKSDALQSEVDHAKRLAHLEGELAFATKRIDELGSSATRVGEMERALEEKTRALEAALGKTRALEADRQELDTLRRSTANEVEGYTRRIGLLEVELTDCRRELEEARDARNLGDEATHHRMNRLEKEREQVKSELRNAGSNMESFQQELAAAMRTEEELAARNHALATELANSQADLDEAERAAEGFRAELAAMRNATGSRNDDEDSWVRRQSDLEAELAAEREEVERLRESLAGVEEDTELTLTTMEQALEQRKDNFLAQIAMLESEIHELRARCDDCSVNHTDRFDSEERQLELVRRLEEMEMEKEALEHKLKASTPLKPESAPCSPRGEGRVSGILSVVVREAHGLVSKDNAPRIDPYVSLTVGQITLNTTRAENTTNPKWESSFVFKPRLPTDGILRLQVSNAANDSADMGYIEVNSTLVALPPYSLPGSLF